MDSEVLAFYWLTEREVVKFCLAGFAPEQRRRLAALRRRWQWDRRVITSPAERFWRR